MTTSVFVRKPSPASPPVWVCVYLVLVFLATFLSGLRALRIPSAWTLGDWLINYSGGFVCRGLPGSLALHLQQLLHVKSSVVLIGISIVLYLTLFVCTGMLAAGVRWNFWMVAAFISPVTVAAPFVSTTGYHKEVFFFASFAVLLARLLYLYRRQLPPSWKESAAIAVVGVAGVLSHELFAIYFPYVLAALYIAHPNVRRLIRTAAVPGLAIAIAMAAVVTHPGTPQLARTVCASIGTNNASLCKGSIQYLGRNQQDARADVVESVQEYHYLSFLPYFTLLGLLPIVAGFRSLRGGGGNSDVRKALMIGSAVSVLMSVPLFAYGADWGRWIEIHLMSLFLLLLFMRSISALTDRDAAAPHISRWQSICRASLLLIYATCWSIPGTTNVPKGGYISMVKRIGTRSLTQVRQGNGTAPSAFRPR